MGELFQYHNSDFLFARPSVSGGAARILDLGGNLKAYDESATGEAADAKAIQQDWKAVGNDLNFAIKWYNESVEK